MLTEEIDIKIEIESALKSYSVSSFVIEYSEMDSILDLKPGSTATFVEQVAKELGYEVRRGESRAKIEKPDPFSVQIARS